MKHYVLEAPFEVVKVTESYEFFTRDAVDMFLRFWKRYFTQCYEIDQKIKSKVPPAQFVKWETEIQKKHEELSMLVNALFDKSKAMLISLDMDIDVTPVHRITAPIHTPRMASFYESLEIIDKTIMYLDLLSLAKKSENYDRADLIQKIVKRQKEVLNLQRTVIEEYRAERRRARSVLRGKSKRFLPHV